MRLRAIVVGPSVRGTALILLAVLVLSSCLHYQPRPIDAQTSLAALEARTLDNPALGRAVKGQLGKTDEWPPRTWTLPTLTLVALYYHPDLEVARSAWASARAAVVTAGERPNPNVSLAAGYNSTTPVSQITPWILTLDLDFTLETAGKRGRRVAVAQRLSEAARLNIASVAWQVRSGVRRSLLDLHAALGAGELLREQRDIQQANIGLLERQLAAGAISPFELTEARLSLASVRLALSDAESAQAEARVRLAAALGLTVQALDGASLSFDSFDQAPADLPASSVRRQALLNRPDVLGALAEYESTQAALQLEIARQYPDVHLGPGYQMDQAENKWALGLAGLLPVFSRNRGPIAEAEARREEAAARFAAVQGRAVEEIDVAAAGYQAARARIETADALLADLDRQEQAAQARWRAGEISKLELGVLRLELVNARLARFDALVKVQAAAGRLEDAMQTPADVPGFVATGAEALPASRENTAPRRQP